MIRTLQNAVLRVVRGAWRPVYPLNPRRRWWDYFEYYSFRSQEVVTAAYIVLFPIAIGFFVNAHYSANPKGIVAVTAVLTALWLLLAWLAYGRGK